MNYNLFESRYLSKIEDLNNKLGTLQNQMNYITDASFETIVNNNNLNESQKNIVQEIFKTSKLNNSKSRRYSENWILLCVLFHIRFENMFSVFLF